MGKGSKNGGEVVSYIRFADDTVILAESIEDLQKLIEGVSRESEAAGLTINVKKTKYMVISTNMVHDTHLTLDGEEIQRVNKYKYLGAIINTQLNSR